MLWQLQELIGSDRGLTDSSEVGDGAVGDGAGAGIGK